MKLHPSFDYRKKGILSADETLMIYQAQYKRLQDARVDLVLVKALLLIETYLPEKSKLLKQQTALLTEIFSAQNSITLALECWQIQTEHMEKN